jgi:hypothetical protein
LNLRLVHSGLFVKREGLKGPIPGDFGPLEPVEKALILTIGLLLDQEAMKDFRDRRGLLFGSLDLLVKGACKSLQA